MFADVKLMEFGALDRSFGIIPFAPRVRKRKFGQVPNPAVDPTGVWDITIQSGGLSGYSYPIVAFETGQTLKLTISVDSSGNVSGSMGSVPTANYTYDWNVGVITFEMSVYPSGSMEGAIGWRGIISGDSIQYGDITNNTPSLGGLMSAVGPFATWTATREPGTGPPPQFTLAYTSDPNGSISGVASQTVTSGGNGSPVTAVPNSGYQFNQWSDGPTDNPRADVNVTANISVMALFSAVPSITVSQPATSVAPVQPITGVSQQTGTALVAASIPPPTVITPVVTPPPSIFGGISTTTLLLIVGGGLALIMLLGGRKGD